MPDTLQHIRHTAEQATDPNAFTPHARVEMDEKGAFWLLALLPIVEAIASTENITVRDENYGARVCRYCKGDARWVNDDNDYEASYWDAEHDADCPHLLARALKEG